MLTEAELIEIRRHTLNGDFASPPIHEALLIKAFCLLTDSQRDDGLLMEWRGNRFTYTQKEITDQEVYDD